MPRLFFSTHAAYNAGFTGCPVKKLKCFPEIYISAYSKKKPAMSFCDFAENVEDAIDQECAYEYEEDTGQGQKYPSLIWLSDIPLFQSNKPVKPGGKSYLEDEDNDTELQCTYQSQRLAYRDEGQQQQVVEEEGTAQKGTTQRVVGPKPEDFDKSLSFTFTLADVPLTFEIVQQVLTCERNDKYSSATVNGDYQINVMFNLGDEERDETRFAINFYQDEIPGETFVEIIFNAGRKIEFLKFYREFKRHLNDVGLATDAISSEALPTDMFAFTPLYQEDVKNIEQDVKKAELRTDLLPAASAEPVERAWREWDCEWI